jgi:hypothetical protein
VLYRGGARRATDDGTTTRDHSYVLRLHPGYGEHHDMDEHALHRNRAFVTGVSR